jgi:Tfp pilus assembly protein PilX
MSIRGLARGQKGQALILALILLVIGGLIMAPLLAYMSTGVVAGGAYEKKAAELYAADAGAQDAVWKIQHQDQVDEVKYLYCGGGNNTYSYNIADVNGKSVAVTITYVSNITHTYHVLSTATGDGSGTKIDAYVTGTYRYGDFSGMMTHVLTSMGTFYCPNPPTPCPCSKLDNLVSPGCDNETNGPEDNYDPLNWPPPDVLASFYWENVKNTTPYGSADIDISGVNQEKGPLYRNGTLTIHNSDSKNAATLKLTGTIYTTGDTQIGYGTSGNFPMTLDLNGNTIFVASNSSDALRIGDKLTIVGPGVIIAVGDIYFKPQAQLGGEDKPIFILSVSGKTLLQPGGDFYGAIAGGLEVDLKAGNKVYYPTGGFGESDTNFPTGVEWLVYSIASWQVKPA